MTLQQLAVALGVSVATMSYLETGKTRFGAVRLAQVSEILAVPIEDLLGGDTTSDRSPIPPTDGVAPESCGSTSASKDADGWTFSDWSTFDPPPLDPVLQAAAREFARIGYHGCSVRDIARTAGMSVSGMYHYYPTKQAMLVEILIRPFEDLLRRAVAARSDVNDPVERFCRLVECLVLYNTHRPELSFMAISETRGLEPHNRAAVTTYRNRIQRMFDDDVEAAVAAGQFAAPVPLEGSRAVVAMCLGISHWYDPTGHTPPRVITERYVELALSTVQASDVPARMVAWRASATARQR
jgi:AcrR family transcriptional regulator